MPKVADTLIEVVAKSLGQAPVFEKIEELIKAGKLAEAQTQIRAMATPRLPRPEVSRFANLARRASLPALSLRALGKLVRVSGRRVSSASPAETIEFAAALSALGANTEAKKILGTIDIARHPQALLIKAFIDITDWNYASARDTLLKYLPQVSDYEARIAKVNLAASYVQENQIPEAEAVLDTLIDEASREGKNLLLTHLLQIAAQSALRQNKIKLGQERIARARSLLPAGDHVFSLMLEKWDAVALLASKADADRGLTQLSTIARRARELGSWETGRDCLFHEALYRGSSEQLRQLYFGTPFVHYRQRLKNEAERRGLDTGFTTGTWEFFMGSADAKNRGSKNPKWTWDLDKGQVRESGDFLKPGQLLHRLSSAIISDYFRPSRMVSIHEEVFPNRHFNPDSSPQLLREAMRRFREWLENTGMPIIVKHDKGAYRYQDINSEVRLVREISVESKGSIAAATSLDPAVRHAIDLVASRHRRDDFTSSDLRKIAHISERTARRYLKRARELGWISADAGTPQVPRYKLALG